MVSLFLNDSFLLCHGLVMTVFRWFQNEKGRCFYCHQKIGTATAVILHYIIAQHPFEEVWLLWPPSSCEVQKVTPVTKAPTVAGINTNWCNRPVYPSPPPPWLDYTRV